MWISVKERLPKNNKDVIVWDAKKKCFREDYYSKDETAGWAKSRQDAVTHWMPVLLFNDLIKKTLKPRHP